MTAYNKTCVTSKDSDQPVHPPSMAKVFFYLWIAWRLYKAPAISEASDQTKLMGRLICLQWLHKS